MSQQSKDSSSLLFLTVNDGPSGVYTGQVIDVVRLLRAEAECRVRLVAMVPLILFRKHRKAIHLQMPDAIVLPMVPKLRLWKLNIALLAGVIAVLGRCSIIARNPLAANLALTCRKLGLVNQVCYDGRGAVAAEIREYSKNNPLEQSITNIERQAVCESDFRIAVSSPLILYWEKELGYKSDRHVIIPCSYSREFENLDLVEARERRRKLGYSETDVVYVFSGGAAGWQSTKLFQDFVSPLLANNQGNKLLLLSRDPLLAGLEQQFPGQVRKLWLESKDMAITLAAGDYGVLLREPTVTNQVAAPVKFAEYLACGLPVICSEGIGNYPDFIRMHDAGIVVKEHEQFCPSFLVVPVEQKIRIKNLAEEYFSKNSQRVKSGYLAVLNSITTCEA